MAITVEPFSRIGAKNSRHRQIGPDDLPMANGRVYHLDLAPEELARNVLVVGDPDRVPLLADEFLLGREVDRCHRGFRSITGVSREGGMPVSIVSTGIGAPSTEIVLNELAALNEIDFSTMTRKESFEPLSVIRVGTSGGLNPETRVGTLALTDYVIGLDNTGLFYDVPPADTVCPALEQLAGNALQRAADQGARFRGTVVPYAARADRRLLAALQQEAARRSIPHVRGITVSSAGFFAEQGRGVARVGSTYPRLLDEVAALDCSPWGMKVENMEMEAGIVLHFLAGMAYRAAAICVVVNTRRRGTFLTDYRSHIIDAAAVALGALRCGAPEQT
jgi:uridine phosphorylase